MNFKRLSFVFLTFCLLIGFTVISADAVDSYVNSTCFNDAVTALREGLKAREPAITVMLQADADTFDGTEASVKALSDQMEARAFEHTGVPTEGDYLRWCVKSMNSYAEYTLDSDTWNIAFTFRCKYYTTAEQEAEVDEVVTLLVEQLQLDQDIDDYVKIANIYDYLCCYVVYDYANFHQCGYDILYTAYGALINKAAVCLGYGAVFYRLALEAGIDARVITGTSNATDLPIGHAWNMVQLDGVYYYVDATWDAGMYDYSYFLKTYEEFSDHYPYEEYKTESFFQAYPQAQTAYVLPDPIVYTDSGYEYKVSAGSAILLTYIGSETDVVVPATLGGFPVYRIARYAFCGNHEIKSLTFSEGICLAGQEHIFGCSSLESIHYPSTMQLVTYSGGKIFSGLSSVPVNCASVHTITVAEGNLNMVIHDNALYTRDMESLLYLPPADTRTVFEIPEGVVTIESDACRENRNLTEVIMPDTVETIQYWSFFDCASLEKINISESCQFIGQYSFEGTALSAIHIPAKLVLILPDAFATCPLQTITVDSENPKYYAVDNVLFSKSDDAVTLFLYPIGNSATEYSVPENVTVLARSSFSCASNLEQVFLPDGLTTIGLGTFSRCGNLKEMEIPGSVKNMDDGVFRNCGLLEKVVFGDGITSIPGSTFSGCMNLKEVSVPDTVSSIEKKAFAGCPGLENIEIPESVVTIGTGAFEDCTKLTVIKFNGNAPQISDDAFWNVTADAYYPIGNDTWNEESMQSYGGALTWKSCCTDAHLYEEIIVAPNCLEQGYTLHACSKCEFSYSSDYVALSDHSYESSVTDPTCTNQGYTTHTCVICGDSYVDSYVDPTGHSYGEWYVVREATCVDDEIRQRDCENCGDCDFWSIAPEGHSWMGWRTIQEATCIFDGVRRSDCENCDVYEVQNIPATGHDYQSSICTQCGETERIFAASFKGASLSLNGVIGVNFYVALSDDMINDPNTRMVFTVGETTQSVPMSKATYYSSGDMYIFTCDVVAKQMAEEITAQVYLGDTAIGNSLTYGVQTYCANKLSADSTASDTLKNLLIAMLNYGSAAQVYFEYNTDDLANSILTDEQKVMAAVNADDLADFAMVTTGSDAGISRTGASLLLEADTTVRYYIQLADGYSIDSYDIMYNGKELAPVASGTNTYYVDVNGIAAKDLDEMYPVTIGGISISYGPMTYVQRQLSSDNANMVNVVTGLYHYNRTANAYFG